MTFQVYYPGKVQHLKRRYSPVVKKPKLRRVPDETLRRIRRIAQTITTFSATQPTYADIAHFLTLYDVRGKNGSVIEWSPARVRAAFNEMLNRGMLANQREFPVRRGTWNPTSFALIPGTGSLVHARVFALRWPKGHGPKRTVWHPRNRKKMRTKPGRQLSPAHRHCGEMLEHLFRYVVGTPSWPQLRAFIEEMEVWHPKGAWTHNRMRLVLYCYYRAKGQQPPTLKFQQCPQRCEIPAHLKPVVKSELRKMHDDWIRAQRDHDEAGERDYRRYPGPQANAHAPAENGHDHEPCGHQNS